MHRRAEPRRDGQRQRAGGLPRPRPLRRAQEDRRRPRGAGPAGRDAEAPAHGAALRAHRPDRRADADRPVVRRDEQARRATAESIAGKAIRAVEQRRGEFVPRAVGQHLQPVDEQHPGLVHLAPALVGPPDPGLVRQRRRAVRRPRRSARRAQRAAAAGYGGRADARRGRARHLVLVGAGAVLDARLARARRSSRTCSCRRACWSPASTSSSSGSRA